LSYLMETVTVVIPCPLPIKPPFRNTENIFVI
jgi:hypothetical protein